MWLHTLCTSLLVFASPARCSCANPNLERGEIAARRCNLSHGAGRCLIALHDVSRRCGRCPTALGRCLMVCEGQALHHAAMRDQVQSVKLLLAAGANANLTSNDGSTALHEAGKAGHIDTVEALVANAMIGTVSPADVSRARLQTGAEAAAWGGRTPCSCRCISRLEALWGCRLEHRRQGGLHCV